MQATVVRVCCISAYRVQKYYQRDYHMIRVSTFTSLLLLVWNATEEKDGNTTLKTAHACIDGYENEQADDC